MRKGRMGDLVKKDDEWRSLLRCSFPHIDSASLYLGLQTNEALGHHGA